MSTKANDRHETQGASPRLTSSAGRPAVSQPGKHAETIRAFRIAAKMNQGDLAQRLGVTNSAVTNWENGYTRPDIDTLVKMCAVLSVSADELLSITDHGKRPTESETLLLESYRSLTSHDRLLVNKLMDAMHEDEFSEFRRTYRNNFKSRPWSPLSACAGTGVDLSGGGKATMLLLRNIDETCGCDEIISITGDSMEPDYHSGDRVMVEHTESLHPGEVGIFVVAGEGLIKVYQEDGLHSLNPAYETIHPEQDDNAKCVGRVLGILTDDMLPTKREQAMINELKAERRK